MKAKTTRQEFCSDKCRVYWNREDAAGFHQKPIASQALEISRNTTFISHATQNNDEIQSQIGKLTAEMNAISEGNFGTPLRNKIQDKINKLKKQLK